MTPRLALYVFAALTLAGCAANMNRPAQAPTHSAESGVSPAVVRHFRGLPSGYAMPTCEVGGARRDPPCAAWAHPHLLYVTTWGSSSCPNLPTSVVVERPNLVSIAINGQSLYPPGTVCTADIALTTAVVRLPALVNSSTVVNVEINGTAFPIAPLTAK